MAVGLLAILDDVVMLLDDAAVMSKVATKKTAALLGDKKPGQNTILQNYQNVLVLVLRCFLIKEDYQLGAWQKEMNVKCKACPYSFGLRSKV